MEGKGYRFASDNTAGLCPEALAALVAANSGREPSYGEDRFTSEAREEVRKLFQTDCDVYFVFTGTASNALALSSLCRGHHSIFSFDFAHVERAECGASEFYTGGSKVIGVPGPEGRIDPAEFERAIGVGRGFHSHKPGALSIAQSSDWGTLYGRDELRALTEIARAQGMGVHMDGARFANALAAFREKGPVTAADLTWKLGVDILSFGGTKNGMLTAEAIVFFRRDLAADFEHRQIQAGQTNSKMRFAAAQWSAVLRDGAWLRHAGHANRMAALLEAEMRAIREVRFPIKRETNMVLFELSPATADRLEALGWRVYKFVGDNGYRLVCGWDTQPQDIAEFIRDLKAAIRG